MDDALVNLGDGQHLLSYRMHQVHRLLPGLALLVEDATMQPAEVGIRLREAVHLLPSPDLQPMLDHAQELVPLCQVLEILAADVRFVVQLLQREQCAAGSEPRLASSIDALQTLHEEFDIANAP